MLISLFHLRLTAASYSNLTVALGRAKHSPEYDNGRQRAFANFDVHLHAARHCVSSNHVAHVIVTRLNECGVGLSSQIVLIFSRESASQVGEKKTTHTP